MLLVIEEKESEDAPHVVLQVRIEKVHGPPLLLGWKAAQHE